MWPLRSGRLVARQETPPRKACPSAVKTDLSCGRVPRPVSPGERLGATDSDLTRRICCSGQAHLCVGLGSVTQEKLLSFLEQPG